MNAPKEPAITSKSQLTTNLSCLHGIQFQMFCFSQVGRLTIVKHPSAPMSIHNLRFTALTIRLNLVTVVDSFCPCNKQITIFGIAVKENIDFNEGHRQAESN